LVVKVTMHFPKRSVRFTPTEIFAFLAIYLIWGSTYLAIRYTVQTIPPLFAAGVRHFTAGAIMLVYCFAKGIRPTRRDLRTGVVLGILFFLLGHGSLHWAEQVVPSGLAALLVATEPIFIALMSPKKSRSGATWAGSLLGIAGVALLARSDAHGARTGLIVAMLVMTVGTLAWSAGMIYSQKRNDRTDPILSAGLAAFIGSLMLLAAGFVTGESNHFRVSQVAPLSFGGLIYLIIFGSVVAFSAYMWLLARHSPALVATHTFVNPIVAVMLAWAVGDEKLSIETAIATLLVVGAVLLVRRGSRPKLSKDLLASAEHPELSEAN
jgi:drug/metabolite transporter (DMT)-like permease